MKIEAQGAECGTGRKANPTSRGRFTATSRGSTVEVAALQPSLRPPPREVAGRRDARPRPRGPRGDERARAACAARWTARSLARHRALGRHPRGSRGRRALRRAHSCSKITSSTSCPLEVNVNVPGHRRGVAFLAAALGAVVGLEVHFRVREGDRERLRRRGQRERALDRRSTRPRRLRAVRAAFRCLRAGSSGCGRSAAAALPLRSRISSGGLSGIQAVTNSNGEAHSPSFPPPPNWPSVIGMKSFLALLFWPIVPVRVLSEHARRPERVGHGRFELDADDRSAHGQRGPGHLKPQGLDQAGGRGAGAGDDEHHGRRKRRSQDPLLHPANPLLNDPPNHHDSSRARWRASRANAGARGSVRADRPLAPARPADASRGARVDDPADRRRRGGHPRTPEARRQRPGFVPLPPGGLASSAKLGGNGHREGWLTAASANVYPQDGGSVKTLDRKKR